MTASFKIIKTEGFLDNYTTACFRFDTKNKKHCFGIFSSPTASWKNITTRGFVSFIGYVITRFVYVGHPNNAKQLLFRFLWFAYGFEKQEANGE